MKFIEPQNFLQKLGITLIIISAMGYLGITGPTSEQSLFAHYWWFSRNENIGYFIVGAISVFASYYANVSNQRYMVLILGVLGIILFAVSLVTDSLLGAHIERPVDSFFILLLTGLAFTSFFSKSSKK